MKGLRLATAFKKDLKRVEKRGNDLDELAAVVNVLREGGTLPFARRDHPLRSDWRGWRECHVRPDWLLIYRTTGTEVLLARTGTHADLFE